MASRSRAGLVFATGCLFLVALWILPASLDVLPVPRARASRSRELRAEGATARARELLASLGPELRARATFAFDDRERFNWHFVPRDRRGLALKDMSPAEREALAALLHTSLSETGVRTVELVRELEAILREIEGPDRRFPRDPELYFLSMFGEPGESARWGWRFEGHHLSLNFTLEGDRLLSGTPLFLGANPALVRRGPRKGLRVLAGVEDLARELATSLGEEQRRAALGKETREVEGTGSERYRGPLPPGVKASTFTEAQRETLKRLVREYTKHLKGSLGKGLEEEILAEDPVRVQFAWRGGLEPFAGHSYMLRGPGFVISYANFQDGAAHVHSALRATPGEFGL